MTEADAEAFRARFRGNSYSDADIEAAIGWAIGKKSAGTAEAWLAWRHKTQPGRERREASA